MRTVVNVPMLGVEQSEGVHRVFTGPEGVASFGVGGVRVPDPAAFRAESVSTDYAGVIVSRLKASGCRIERTGPVEAVGEGLALALVLEGRLRVGQDGAQGECDAGDLFTIACGGDNFVHAESPFQSACLFVPADRVPPRMLVAGALPLGALPETRLVGSVAAFLRRLAAGPAVGHGPDRVYLARAVAELAVAVVAEAMGDDLPDDKATALRMRVREHIEQHLGDPDLGPQQIAAALGVSVRYVHRVFNVEGETVARFIRERRLEAVARLLRVERRPQRVGALAARFGFSGRDHLTRAFRQRYGATLREYQDAVGVDPAVLAGTRLPG